MQKRSSDTNGSHISLIIAFIIALIMVCNKSHSIEWLGKKGEDYYNSEYERDGGKMVYLNVLQPSLFRLYHNNGKTLNIYTALAEKELDIKIILDGLRKFNNPGLPLRVCTHEGYGGHQLLIAED